MLFTYSQFEKTKRQIFQQFKKKPAIDVACYEWDKGFNQYRKILNDLKFYNKNKTRNCKSATRIRNTNIIDETIVIADKFKPITINQNFYLTEAIVDMSSSKRLQENLYEQQQQQEEDSMLMDIIIKLSQSEDESKNLKTDIKELENSIRFYRKNNYAIQYKLSQQGRKQNMVQNILLKKKDELNLISHKNFEFKDKVNSAERFFGRSLKQIQYSVKNNEKKANQMTEEVAEAILTYKKLRQKLKIQQNQLEQLQYQKQNKQNKISKMKQLFLKAKSLFWTMKLSKNIRAIGYGQIQKIQKIFSECIKNQANSKKQKQQQLHQIQETNVLKISKQILKLYKKMRQDQQKLKSIYETKIIQQKQFQIQLQHINKNRSENQQQDACNSLQKRHQAKILTYQNSQYNQRQKFCLKVLQTKKQRLCEMAMSMQQRSKFFLKKQLKLMILIVENWLKYDESTLVFLNQIINSYIAICLESKNQEYSHDDFKNDLIGHFQNWQKYYFFYEQIIKNCVIWRNLNRKRVIRIFRRIIKTKLNNQNIPTQQLFIISLRDLFKQNFDRLSNNLLNLWQLHKKIYQYSSKFQVLIINTRQSDSNFRISTKVKTKLCYQGLTKKSKKLLQKQQQDQIQKYPLNIQKQNYHSLEEQQNVTYPQLNNYIYEYQQQLNKIVRLNKKKRPKTTIIQFKKNMI